MSYNAGGSNGRALGAFCVGAELRLATNGGKKSAHPFIVASDSNGLLQTKAWDNPMKTALQNTFQGKCATQPPVMAWLKGQSPKAGPSRKLYVVKAPSANTLTVCAIPPKPKQGKLLGTCTVKILGKRK